MSDEDWRVIAEYEINQSFRFDKDSVTVGCSCGNTVTHPFEGKTCSFMCKACGRCWTVERRNDGKFDVEILREKK